MITICDMFEVRDTNKPFLFGNNTNTDPFMNVYKNHFEELDPLICANYKGFYPIMELSNPTTTLELWQKSIKGLIALHRDEWQKMYDALSSEYDPISNYDRTEVSTTTTGTQTNTVDYGAQRTEITTGTRTNSTVTGAQSSTNTHSVAPFDTNTFSNSEKDDTTAQARTDTNTLGGGVDEQATDGYINTFDNGSREDTFNSHIKGNIGVTTSQQMINSELELRKFDLFDYIVKELFDKTCYFIDDGFTII